MRDKIIAILRTRIGARFAGEDYNTDWVIGIDGIDEAVDEIMKLLSGNALGNPITLQGYSYPLARLADVIAAEAQQGRTVTIATQHAGGWTVTNENPACTCRIYIGDDEDCPAHRREAT